ncbi:MAG: hypothetical protein ABI650_09540 [Dokdonella sp.]
MVIASAGVRARVGDEWRSLAGYAAHDEGVVASIGLADTDRTIGSERVHLHAVIRITIPPQVGRNDAWGVRDHGIGVCDTVAGGDWHVRVTHEKPNPKQECDTFVPDEDLQRLAMLMPNAAQKAAATGQRTHRAIAADTRINARSHTQWPWPARFPVT